MARQPWIGTVEGGQCQAPPLACGADRERRSDQQRDLRQVRKLLAGEIDAYDVEKRYIHKDGHVVWA